MVPLDAVILPDVVMLPPQIAPVAVRDDALIAPAMIAPVAVRDDALIDPALIDAALTVPTV